MRHLEANGCTLLREGARHSVYYNPVAQRTSTVPRHREVKNPTAIRICKQLSVPDPLR
ncbi:MAG: type II toxin-antitoxin system HicA family toxin [Acidobacteriota bacterium]